MELTAFGEQGYDDFIDDVFEEFSVEVAGSEQEALAEQRRSGIQPAFSEG